MTAIAPPADRSCRVSWTLTAYLARHFLRRFFMVFGGLMAVTTLVTAVEMLDQIAGKPHATTLIALEMALLKLPHLAQEIMPFILLFAAMASLWRIARSRELVVARAAGVSVWQILAPPVGVAIVIGIFTTTLLNPLAAVLLKRQERLHAHYTSYEPASFAVAATGLWLRQVHDGDATIIHAREVTQNGASLRDVTMFRFEGQDTFKSRLDAARAQLADGHWLLEDITVYRPGEVSERIAQRRIKTSLTPTEIYHSFAPPETISFWALPDFIAVMAKAGFTAEPQKLQYHRLLSMPVLLAAMTLLAAAFTLQSHRYGHVALLIASGVLTGVGVHVMSNLVFAIGLGSRLPVAIAAWAPAAATLMLALAALLYLEDG